MKESSAIHPMKPFLYYWLPFLVHMGLIYYLSSRSSFPVEVPDWIEFADKIAHVLLYGILTVFTIRAYHYGWGKALTPFSLTGIVFFVSAYGITDEWHQAYVPGRTPEFADWLTDTIVAIVICFMVYLYKRFYKSISKTNTFEQ